MGNVNGKVKLRWNNMCSLFLTTPRLLQLPPMLRDELCLLKKDIQVQTLAPLVMTFENRVISHII
jgi:hypothetical protein